MMLHWGKRPIHPPDESGDAWGTLPQVAIRQPRRTKSSERPERPERTKSSEPGRRSEAVWGVAVVWDPCAIES